MRTENEQGEKLKKKKGVLVVLTGPTGVGKDTVMKGILDSEEIESEKLVTLASRKPRNDKEKNIMEVRGWDYHFVGERAFLRLKDDGEFLEDKDYGYDPEFPDKHDYKGTLRRSILKVNEGKTVVWRIDMEAASRVDSILRDNLSEAEYDSVADSVVVVLIWVNSIDELKNRVIAREGEGYDKDKFNGRMNADLEIWKTYSFPNVVYNEPSQVDVAVAQILTLIHEKQEG